jgi:hypothetical protein
MLTGLQFPQVGAIHELPLPVETANRLAWHMTYYHQPFIDLR